MKRLRDLLTPLSLLRYLAWRAFPAGRQVTVRLRTGERFSLRPEPAEDLATAFELFVAEVYRPPFPVDTAATRRIVDVGEGVSRDRIGERVLVRSMLLTPVDHRPFE